MNAFPLPTAPLDTNTTLYLSLNLAISSASFVITVSSALPSFPVITAVPNLITNTGFCIPTDFKNSKIILLIHKTDTFLYSNEFELYNNKALTRCKGFVVVYIKQYKMEISSISNKRI